MRELNNEEIDFLVDLIDKEISVLIVAHKQGTITDDTYNVERQFLDDLRPKLEEQKK